MSSPGFIYGLFDSRDPDRIRYVGQTRNRLGVKDRVYHHRWDSANRVSSPVRRWILEIGQEHLKYRILSCVPKDILDHEEVWHISERRSLGQADLNMLDGGQGFSDGGFPGGENGNSRLTEEIVRDLRTRAPREYVSTAKEAKRLGVTPSTISKVLKNRSWFDPGYDPEARVSVQDHNSRSSGDLVWRSHSDSEIEDLRSRFLSGETLTEISRDTGTPVASVSRFLFHEYASETTRRECIRVRTAKGRKPPRVLSGDDETEIRRLYATGTFTQKGLAILFEVPQSRVCKILNAV
jgi:hypothetical protein